MLELLSKESNYNDVISLTKKNSSPNELIYLILKQYFTTNEVYFFLLYIFRILHAIICSGNYYYKLKINKNVKVQSMQNWIRFISVYHLLEVLQISDKAYMIICFIMLILSLIRILMFFYLKYQLKEINNNKYPKVSKYHLFMEHLVFLLCPYILEYLSFIYYIYFNPNTFIIKKNSNSILFILIMIINTFLIFGYNFSSYFYMMCSNKIYTTSIFDAYLNINNPKEYIKRKPNIFKLSDLAFYIKLILPNLSLFHTMELYLTFSNLKNFVIIVSFILLFCTTALNICTIHGYNYSTFINKMNYTLLSYISYSIIFDFILYIFEYPVVRISNEIIYILLKMFVSYLTYLMNIKVINNKYLQNKIIEMLFQEKSNKKEDINIFINTFLYFNELMAKIKEKNDLNSAYLLMKFLNKHIKDCKKLICNCQLIKKLIQDNIKTKNGENSKDEANSKGYISNLLIILNYLYESIFIEYDYYNNFDLTILLAEHFCHLRDNPTMAFSFINSLIIKQRKKLKTMENVVLYELLQKYIYFIKAKIHKDLINEIQENKNDLLSYEQRSNYYKTFYINLKMSNNIKKLICAYVDNEIKIIKYKNLFDDSLSFKFDENNEKINFVKINFFNQSSTIDISTNNNNKQDKRENIDNTYHTDKNNSNLLNIIKLLKTEQKNHKKIIDIIENMEIFKGMPIFIIFKLYLFFDIFEGGKISASISDKLYEAFSNINIKSIYDTNITTEIYSSLISRYKKQNYQIDSKYFAMWEYKKELRTIYLSEICGLRLGYKQKDIINEKIDLLMPREFCKSHQNLVKQNFIYRQCRYFESNCRYFFDSTSTVLYAINSEGTLIYDISKNLVLISESIFNYENEYKFMLNNNFDLLGHSKNFEEEYSLNQNIFQTYNLKIMDILQIKLQTLQDKFSNEFKKVQYQKKIRQGKTEEYFTPQLYVPSGEKHLGMMNNSNFNSSKNYLISKIIGNDDTNENIESKLLQNNDDIESEISNVNEKSKKIINDLLINPSQIIFHDTINFNLNKYKFIENLHKELTKIPDNDLMFENNKENYNLILSSKSLISKLLFKNDLRDNAIDIKIKMSYYYDKAFYFITINDPKKLYLKISVPLFLKTKHATKESISSSRGRRYGKLELKKSRNRGRNTISKTKKNEEYNSKKKEKNTSTQENTNFDNSTDTKDFKSGKSYDNPFQLTNAFSTDNFVMEKIEKYRKEINKEEFIYIIKCALSIVCILILIVYFLILKYQKNTTKLINYFFFANLYNYHIKDNMLLIHSYLLRLFIGKMVIRNNKLITLDEYKILMNLPNLLKVNFHNFTEIYYKYNLKIGHDFDLFYKKRTVLKLKCYWEQISYETDYLKEMDSVIYNIYAMQKDRKGPTDIDYFLFEKGFKEKKQKVQTISIQLLYYFIVNYDAVWEVLFNEMEETILDCYNKYINKTNSIYYSLEVIGLLLYLIFYCCIFIYLYYSNIIITKNIIFLFLDFNEDQYDTNKYNQTSSMTLKLLEFRRLINDFDLEKLQIYADNLNFLKNNKIQNLTNIDNTYLGNEQHVNNLNNGDSMNNSNIIDNNSNIMNNGSTNKTILSRQTIVSSQQKILLNPKETEKKISNKDTNLNTLQDKTIYGNNSSINYLNKTNSKFYGMNGQTTHVNLMNINSTNNDTTTNKTETLNNYLFKKNSKNNTIKDKNSYENDEVSTQDIILNKSNKNIILIIKIYMISVICMTAIITLYIIFSFYRVNHYIKKINNLFSDFTIIMNRYAILFYYFNALRSVIVLPSIGNKNITINDLIEHYNEENKKYKEILSNRIDNYKIIKSIINSFSDYKDNSISIINNTICENDSICINYINSSDNIVNSGIDFAFESSITEVSKFFSDYSKLNNKTDEEEVKANILDKREYILIEKCLNIMFYFVKEKLYSSFKEDENNIIVNYNTNIIILNVISILFSVFNLSFTVVFIFITISNYSKPIKASTYRIHYSFYYIKKYNISKYRKSLEYE